MAPTIYKYTLGALEQQVFHVPKGGSPISAQMQRDVPCIWVMVDEDVAEKGELQVTVVGTGRRIPSNAGAYLCSFQSVDQQRIYHVFTKTL